MRRLLKITALVLFILWISSCSLFMRDYHSGYLNIALIMDEYRKVDPPDFIKLSLKEDNYIILTHSRAQQDALQIFYESINYSSKLTNVGHWSLANDTLKLYTEMIYDNGVWKENTCIPSLRELIIKDNYAISVEESLSNLVYRIKWPQTMPVGIY